MRISVDKLFIQNHIKFELHCIRIILLNGSTNMIYLIHDLHELLKDYPVLIEHFLYLPFKH